MPTFKEMKPAECWQAIEGLEDCLTAEAQRLDNFYQAHRCPRCRSELQKEFDSRHAWNGSSPIARALLRCPICRYLHDPHNNLVVEYGDASKIPLDPYPMIGNPEK